MACLGLLGCKNTHRSTGSYVLMVLMILGIALAVRVLLYALARWLQRRQQHGSTGEEGGEGGVVEMQGGQPVLYGNTQRLYRRTPMQEKCVAHVCATITADDNSVTHPLGKSSATLTCSSCMLCT